MSKLIMLDSAELIAEAFVLIRDLEGDHDLDLPFLKLHLRNFVNIATHCVIKLIESRSVFPVDFDSPHSGDMNAGEFALGQIFDLNVKGLNKAKLKSMVSIAKTIEDHIQNALSSQVLAHVKANNHNTWTVVPIGRNIAMVEGEDYRVIKYHELTNTERPSEDFHVDLNPVIHYLAVRLGQSLSKDNGFYVDPMEELLEPVVCDLIVTKFLIDSLIRKYPNMELVDDGSPARRTLALIDTIENFDSDVYEMLSGSIDKILNTYDEYVFRDVLSSDVHYDVSLTAGRLTLSPIDTAVRTEQNEEFHLKCLVTALLNGDYLPEADRKAAEAYYASNSHLFN